MASTSTTKKNITTEEKNEKDTVSATTTTTITTISEESYENLKKENESLKDNISRLNEKMNLLMEQMLKMGQVSNTTSKVTDSNKDVEVFSMVIGKLLLSTTGKSDGKMYIFNEQFEAQPIPFNDLKEICRTMKSFAQNGKFFINDEEVVRELGLVSSYRSILDAYHLQNIFSLAPNDFVAEYNRVNKAQKAVIENMVANKCLMDEDIDANILKALSKVTGRDYMNIEPLPEEYLNREG